MLSRIADALFWLNRYMERADGLLRVTTTHYILSLDKDVNGGLSWKHVLELFTSAAPGEIEPLQHNSGAALQKLITDTTNINSLKMILTRARENARGVQDHITKEVWEEVNSGYHLMSQANLNQQLAGNEAMEVLDTMIRHSVLYTGITDITMARGMGWSFMNLGKYIERCLEALALVDKQFEQIHYKMTEPRDIMQWRYLLLSLSGYELHLKTYRTAQYNRNVLHQVLFNEDFPHSVLYSLQRIERHLEAVIAKNASPEDAALMRCFGRLYSKVRYMDLDSLNDITLPAFLQGIRTDLLQFTKRFVQNFFSYS